MSRGFENWFREVDGEVLRLSGLSVRDLPDCPYGDWYPMYTARAAAKKALNEAGW